MKWLIKKKLPRFENVHLAAGRNISYGGRRRCDQLGSYLSISPIEQDIPLCFCIFGENRDFGTRSQTIVNVKSTKLAPAIFPTSPDPSNATSSDPPASVCGVSSFSPLSSFQGLAPAERRVSQALPSMQQITWPYLQRLTLMQPHSLKFRLYNDLQILYRYCPDRMSFSGLDLQEKTYSAP